MSSAEPLNFGRKIKDLKRLYKKSYSDLCAGLKVSRERIIALEENEREPSDTERLRFANFYNLPPEELGLFPGSVEKASVSAVNIPAANTAAPVPRPYTNPNPAPAVPGNNANYFTQNVNANSNYNQPSTRPANYGNINERPNLSNTRQPTGPNPNFRPGPNPNRPTQSPGNSSRPANLTGPSTRPAGQATPKPQSAPKSKKETNDDNGEPKPVIKYTAEQLGDIESAYLRKQRDLKVPLKFTFLNGKEYTGVVVDFTPFTVHIIESGTGEEVILRKLAMAYYRKADALAEAQAEMAASNKVAEKPVSPANFESEQ